MKITRLAAAVLAVAAAAIAGPALGAEETSAALSPNCDEEKIKEIAGDALVKIAKSASGQADIYDVTLDTSKLSFAKLMQKMSEAGCF